MINRIKAILKNSLKITLNLSLYILLSSIFILKIKYTQYNINGKLTRKGNKEINLKSEFNIDFLNKKSTIYPITNNTFTTSLIDLNLLIELVSIYTIHKVINH